jgi:hypothetical protein
MMISCLHIILLVDILGGPSSYGYFLCEHFWGETELSRSARHLPLQVFFNGKLVVHPHHIPTFLAALAYYKGIISYPPRVKA